MDLTLVITSILTLLAGIGIFLIACSLMSHNLEAASSTKLKNMFAKAGKSKLLGVGIGTLGTAAIQSSGATTVMTIGFVNAGIISLYQAATIIYGANIGTTITAQIVALGMGGGSGISTTVIFSAFAGIGAFMTLFSSKSNGKVWGGVLAGFGMLFVGLELMKDSMDAFAAMDEVKIFLASIKNPILLVLVGTILTAIIQSSSVMTSIALAMCVTGLITLDQGIFLTMGSNIGSCVVAVIAGITSGINAKRTALIHLIFNCFGVVLWLLLYYVLVLASGARLQFGTIFEHWFPLSTQFQLAMFHTVFNFSTVCIMLPLTNLLVNIVTKVIKDNEKEEAVMRLAFVDDNMLRTPPIAVEQTKQEVLRMAELAQQNFRRSLQIVTTLDYSEVEAFNKTEDEINYINRALVDFVVKLSEQSGLNERDRIYLSTIFRSVRDIERIGDHADNIIEYADQIKDYGQHFSAEALNEIKRLGELIEKLYELTIKSYRDEDIDALVEANIVEEQVDDFTLYMEDKHIQRLSEGICTPMIGAQYLSLSSNAERVADHLINVAKSIRSLPAY